MDLQTLITSASTIRTIVEGTGWKLDESIDEVVASRDWELAGRLLVSAAEVSARQLAQKLVAAEAYTPLAIAACFRRQPRRHGEGTAGGGVSRNVFRDIDAEADAKGVPDYIRADIEELAKTADQTRSSAMSREAAMDRDAIRQYIIDQLGPRLPHSEAAMDAMVAIVHASAWEETRRSAALKVANDPISVARLARGLRTADLVVVAEMALLKAVAETLAREMGKHFKPFSDARDIAALRFMAENHPDPKYRETAAQWVEALEKQAQKPS